MNGSGCRQQFEATCEQLRNELLGMVADVEKEIEINLALTHALKARGLAILRERKIQGIGSLIEKLESDEMDDQAFEGQLLASSLRRQLQWLNDDLDDPASNGNGAEVERHLTELLHHWTAVVTQHRGRAAKTIKALLERSQWLGDSLAELN
jgi:hypothetical protein